MLLKVMEKALIKTGENQMIKKNEILQVVKTGKWLVLSYGEGRLPDMLGPFKTFAEAEVAAKI